MRNLKNKKGVAMLLVAGLVVVAVPVTMLLLNLSKTQKDQTIHYNNVLSVEQISLSGINMGYSRLKSGYDRGYNLFLGEISGKDRYDLNMTQTGSKNNGSPLGRRRCDCKAYFRCVKGTGRMEYQYHLYTD